MRRRRATVATPGEWQCKTARNGEWAQHFSNASCYISRRRVWDIQSVRLFATTANDACVTDKCMEMAGAAVSSLANSC